MQERIKRRGQTVYLSVPGRTMMRPIFHVEDGLTPQQFASVDVVISLANMALNVRAGADRRIKIAYPQR